MKLTIAVCEDMKQMCDLICEQISSLFNEQNCSVKVYGYYSPKELLESLEQHNFHVFFLDIDMPGMDGIQLAEQIRAQRKDLETVIIFVSNKQEMVFESLKERPLRFIRKSRLDSEIPEAVQAILSYYRKNQETVIIEQKGIVTALAISKIRYIESLNRVIIIHTTQEERTVYSKLNDMERQLIPHGFIRIHKSYLVNWKYIYSIESRFVLMDNQEQLPLSKHRITTVKEQYRRLIKQSLINL